MFVPPPRIGEGVRGWGLGAALQLSFVLFPLPASGRGLGGGVDRRAAPDDLTPPGPPLRSGEGGAKQKQSASAPPFPSPKRGRGKSARPARKLTKINQAKRDRRPPPTRPPLG